MRIAVNTRLLLADRLEGLGTFTYEVMKRMVRNHPEHEFIFIFDRPWNEKFIFSDNVTPFYKGPPARHAFLFIYWFEFVLPKILSEVKADVFLSPDGYLSLRSEIKQIPVIHDLNFEHHPEFFGWANQQHYKNFFWRYAKKAARIATVSEFSKKDIVETYKIDPGKIDVVYNGVDDIFKPATEEQKKKIKAEFADGKDYFVFIGGLYLRKNLKNAVLAFDKFKSETGSDLKFIVAGKRHKESEELFRVFNSLKHKEDIIFLGRVEPREKIPSLLSGALALVYVSWFEGFGLPIAEAMKCETAIITSNTTSMPEIAAGAALLVNPYEVSSISNAMKNMTENAGLRQQLLIQGKSVVQKYTWEKTANSLWNCLEKIM